MNCKLNLSLRSRHLRVFSMFRAKASREEVKLSNTHTAYVLHISNTLRLISATRKRYLNFHSRSLRYLLTSFQWFFCSSSFAQRPSCDSCLDLHPFKALIPLLFLSVLSYHSTLVPLPPHELKAFLEYSWSAVRYSGGSAKASDGGICLLPYSLIQ